MKQRRETLDTEVLKREVRRLSAIEASWTTVDPEERVAFHAEWHDLMNIFSQLVVASESGRLGEVEDHDLRDVARALAAAVPLIERLRLRQPDPEILARISLAAAS